MKILGVDDKVENRYLLESVLGDAGYEVAPVRNGVEALAKLEKEPFDLIISDILMPEMDGFQLCHEVKQRAALRHIPFVFYTATYTDKQDEALALRLGASRFITKPVAPEDFLGILRQVIEDYKAGRLTSASPPGEEEEALLKAYNRRLLQKLDRKVCQLQLALEEKEAELVRRQKAEAEVRRLNAVLEERVRQRTAELAVANHQLETFASAVSHDLRTPLRAIEGLSQILARSCAGRLDPHATNCLERQQCQIHQMDRLIQALLQLSRATRAELRREPVDLSQMAREIEKDLRRDQPTRQADFQIAPNLVAQGDPVLLRAALANLLGNAWKFTGKAPQARIEFGLSEREGKPVYFVRDNGTGFDMADAARLFVAFQRLHPSAEFPGTGIGLVTVRQIIHRHGGDIWAEGAAGKGATFYFTLQ